MRKLELRSLKSLRQFLPDGLLNHPWPRKANQRPRLRQNDVGASPKPAEIIEIGAIRSLVNSGQLVIACGGGGIPVTRQGNHLKGASAVIDKDFASCLLAENLDADFLIILTAVEKAAIRFGKPDVKWLDDLTVEEAESYIEEGHFAPGSMLPKVQAAVNFARSGEGRTALITLLEKAKDGILGKTGTRIHR